MSRGPSCKGCLFFGCAAAALVVGIDGDPAQIRLSAGSLQLGNAGTDHVALASKVDGMMALIKSLAGALGAIPWSSTSGCTPPN